MTQNEISISNSGEATRGDTSPFLRDKSTLCVMLQDAADIARRKALTAEIAGQSELAHMFRTLAGSRTIAAERLLARPAAAELLRSHLHSGGSPTSEMPDALHVDPSPAERDKYGSAPNPWNKLSRRASEFRRALKR